jgi:hypothetical protein
VTVVFGGIRSRFLFFFPRVVRALVLCVSALGVSVSGALDSVTVDDADQFCWGNPLQAASRDRIGCILFALGSTLP